MASRTACSRFVMRARRESNPGNLNLCANLTADVTPGRGIFDESGHLSQLFGCLRPDLRGDRKLADAVVVATQLEYFTRSSIILVSVFAQWGGRACARTIRSVPTDADRSLSSIWRARIFDTRLPECRSHRRLTECGSLARCQGKKMTGIARRINSLPARVNGT